jgi:hypothetical protein
MLLMPQNLRNSLTCSVCPELFSTVTCFYQLVTVKLCIGRDRMSNRQKFELVSDNFSIQRLWGGHREISLRARFMPKCTVAPEFLIQQSG